LYHVYTAPGIRVIPDPGGGNKRSGLSLFGLNLKDMKVIVCTVILLLALLICGCTTVSQESGTAPAVVPGMIGNWTGTVNAYDDGKGYNNVSGDVMTLMVTGQQDRIFSGDVIFTNQSGYTWSTAFACAISHDGKTLTMVQRDGGYSTGTVISPEEIELIYTDNSKPFTIGIDSLKKT
jgi:hypothetical protein